MYLDHNVPSIYSPLFLHKSHKLLHLSSILIFLIPRHNTKLSFSQVLILTFFSLVFLVAMRAEVTLDLNSLPDDPSIDIFPFSEEGSSSSSSSGGLKEKQTQEGKEYECRFCSLKFFKSQALGGHMNRHRQERETESLNKARDLVLRNDSFPPHQGPAAFTYHQGDVHMGDLITPFKPMIHQPCLFSISPLSSPTQPALPYLYPPTHSSYPHHHTNNYFNDMRHQTLSNSSVNGDRAPPESSYTFIGAPMTNG